MARNAPLDIIDFGQFCPLGNYPVGISFNQVDNGEFWIVTKSNEIYKKKFFYQLFNIIQQQKIDLIFFIFFKIFPWEGCLVGISFNQVEVFCLDRGLGGGKSGWSKF